MTQTVWNTQRFELSDAGVDGTVRRVTVAIPSSASSTTSVVYCADGQIVNILAAALTRSLDGESPILVGVHSNGALRADEYLLSPSPHFAAHEKFFNFQLRMWVRNEFDIVTERDNSIVFGYSNGGAFSFATALRHPELYAASISFSAPRLPTMPDVPCSTGPRPSVYLATGNLGPEKSFHKNVLRLSRWLRKNDMSVTFSEKPAGHSLDFWTSEFVCAVSWLNARAT